MVCVVIATPAACVLPLLGAAPKADFHQHESSNRYVLLRNSLAYFRYRLALPTTTVLSFAHSNNIRKPLQSQAPQNSRVLGIYEMQAVSEPESHVSEGAMALCSQSDRTKFTIEVKSALDGS